MSNIVEFVKQQEQLFCGALTEQTVTWAKESQFAIQYFQKNDYLAKTALANPTSAQKRHHQCCGDRHHLKPGQQTGLSGSSRRHGVP